MSYEFKRAKDICDEMKDIKNKTLSKNMKGGVRPIKDVTSFGALLCDRYRGNKQLSEVSSQRRPAPTVTTCFRLNKEIRENFKAVDYQNESINYKVSNFFGDMLVGGEGYSETDQVEGQRRVTCITCDLSSLKGSLKSKIQKNQEEASSFFETVDELLYSSTYDKKPRLNLLENDDNEALRKMLEKAEAGDTFTATEAKENEILNCYNHMFSYYETELSKYESEDVDGMLGYVKEFLYGLFVPDTLIVLDCGNVNTLKLFLSTNLDGLPLTETDTALTVLANTVKVDTNGLSKKKYIETKTNEVSSLLQGEAAMNTFFALFAADHVNQDRPIISGERITLSESGGYSKYYKENLLSDEKLYEKFEKFISVFKKLEDFTDSNPQFKYFFWKSAFSNSGLLILWNILKKYSDRTIKNKNTIEQMLEILFAAALRCALTTSCGSGLCLQNQFSILNEINWNDPVNSLKDKIASCSNKSANNKTKKIPALDDTLKELKSYDISFNSRKDAIKLLHYTVMVKNSKKCGCSAPISLDDICKPDEGECDHFVPKNFIDIFHEFMKYCREHNGEAPSGEKFDCFTVLTTEQKEKFEGVVNCFANFFLIPKELNKVCGNAVFGNKKRDKYVKKLAEEPFCFINVVKKQDFTNLVEGVENMRDDIIKMCKPILTGEDEKDTVMK